MRLVSLVASNTEIVHALGLADQLVGVDDYSDYPPSVRELPRLGKELDIQVERVKALEPDLVLASLSVPGHEKVVAALEAEGLPLLVLDPESLEDVLDSVLVAARALGVPGRGERLVEELRAAMPPVEPVDAGRPAVLVEWWPKPVIVPGRRSWVTDLLWRAGARNPFGERDVRSTPITDEEAVAARPEAVVISWCGVDPSHYRPEVVRRREAWQEIPALRHDRILPVSEAYLGRPGPRLVEGYRALRRLVESMGVSLRDRA